MTHEQEKIAEDFIKALKTNNGQPSSWRDFALAHSIGKPQMNQIVQSLKEPDWDLVEEAAPNSTMIRLKKKGWDFTDFATHKQKIQKEKERQDQISDLTLRKLKLEQFPAKFWWLLLLISAIISILTTWVGNRIEQSSKPSIPIEQVQPLIKEDSTNDAN